MKQLALFLPLSLALFACGTTVATTTPSTPSVPSAAPAPTPAPTVTAVSLSGAAPLLIGSSAPLTATVTYSDGTTSTSAARFTSSDTNALSVSSGGVLTARHLTVNGQPVTLTASAGGQSATATVSTYGLDAIGGTVASPNLSTPGYFATARFRAQDGSSLTASTSYTITGPGNFNGGSPFKVSIGPSGSDLAYLNVAAVSGTYTASLTVGGATYTRSFTVDASSVLSVPASSPLTLTGTNSSYTLGGSFPGGVAEVRARLFTQGSSPAVAASTALTASLPGTAGWVFPSSGTTSLASGSYTGSVYGFSAPIDQTVVLPDQVNFLNSSLGTITIP